MKFILSLRLYSSFINSGPRVVSPNALNYQDLELLIVYYIYVYVKSCLDTLIYMGYQTSSRCRILIFPSMTVTLSFLGKLTEKFPYFLYVSLSDKRVSNHSLTCNNACLLTSQWKTDDCRPASLLLKYSSTLMAYIANSMNPDQTADCSLCSSLIRVQSVCFPDKTSLECI